MIRYLLESFGRASMHVLPAITPDSQHMERVVTKSKKTASKAKGRRAKVAITKLQLLEEMLRRPEGGTIAQLSKALGWKSHSVRGAISGALKKQPSLVIGSDKVEGEDRVYRIIG
jgi:hypothetical protein